MTGSVAIDVVIGLIFIYLLYSLLASILQEAITNFLALRSKMLLKSIARMLEDDNPWTNLRLLNFLWEQVKNIGNSFFYSFINRPLTKEFYEHPTIKYLSESSWNNKPSYLKADTFAQVIIDMLRGPMFDGTQKEDELIRSTLSNNTLMTPKGKRLQISSETLHHLKLLFNNSGGDIEKFKFYLEGWFNEVQQRTTGWFKKQAQFMLFFIGLVLAYSFNVDSIAIAKILSSNDKMREIFVEFSLSHYKDVYSDGQKVLKGDTLAAQEDIELARMEMKKAMAEANSILGLGRKDTCLAECQKLKKEMYAVMIDTTLTEDARIEKVQELCGEIENTKVLSSYQKNLGLAILGWILTALAISLGAPFWFDLLNKVAVIRTSLKPQEPKGPPTDSTIPNNFTNVPPGNRVG